MEVPHGKLADIRHRTVKVNGISMHIVEQGQGPLVLLLHGFPEFWYSWRYQIPALAEAGYHVVAPDLRGHGQSDAPRSSSVYTSFHLVGDLVALLDVLEEKQAFVVGHDWGAMVAWDLCLLRPDCVKAVVCLSVPFFPRLSKGSAIKRYYDTLGEGFYMCRFQKPGRAEGFRKNRDDSHTVEAFVSATQPLHGSQRQGADGFHPHAEEATCVDLRCGSWVLRADVREVRVDGRPEPVPGDGEELGIESALDECGSEDHRVVHCRRQGPCHGVSWSEVVREQQFQVVCSQLEGNRDAQGWPLHTARAA